jgi:Ca-activated chloride channel homolog
MTSKTTDKTTARERTLLLLAVWPLLMGLDLLRSRNPEVEKGNELIKGGKADEALQSYDKAAERLPKDPGVHFNRGSALYNLQRYEDAAQAFLRATEARPAPLKASAFHNLGNAFAKASKWAEAVEAYKKSLAYAPGDVRTKWNLELALRKKRDEEKNQDKNQDKNKDGKPDKDKKDGDQKPDDKGEQAKNDPSESGDEKSGDKEGQGDRNAEDEQKKDEQKEEPPSKDKPGEDKQPEQQQAKQDQQKPPEPGSQPQPKPPDKQDKQASEGQPGGKEKPGKQESADMAEVEAILDNLEKSPKTVEQELAKVRAFQRRPPAKDW